MLAHKSLVETLRTVCTVQSPAVPTYGLTPAMLSGLLTHFNLLYCAFVS